MYEATQQNTESLKKNIVRVTEFGDTYLAYREDTLADPEDITDAGPLRLEELANFCDLGAEGANNHQFVGSHRILAALLFRMLGRERATEVMREIAERGGLDEMNGNGSDGDAYAELGITEPWKDWNLPDGEPQV